MVLNPRESGEFIIKNAKHLKINEICIDKLKNLIVEGIKTKTIDVNNFSQNQIHPSCSDEHAINWIFICDTLNFCFWTHDDTNTKWRVDNHTGYFALCAALNRARKEGYDITNPHYYSKISYDELAKILRSDDQATKVPLLEERVRCLHEVGTKLIEKYDGKFENCIKECKGSAQKLLNLIITEFPCFRDEADFNGERVSLYKRAQILIGDIWSCFHGKDLGNFVDIDTITMFADYRIPQVLIHFGILEYSTELLEFLKSKELLKNGDEREVEIRGASIFIVEKLKQKVLEEIANNHPNISKANINSILLDHFLWDYRRKYSSELEYIPFHKVLSIYY